jgi:hypothetical protein
MNKFDSGGPPVSALLGAMPLACSTLDRTTTNLITAYGGRPTNHGMRSRMPIGGSCDPGGDGEELAAQGGERRSPNV